MQKPATIETVLRLLGPEDCALRFAILNSWFGPPLIWTVTGDRSQLVDGRTRLEQWHGSSSTLPSVQTLTPRSTVRALCAAGEYERAASYVPGNIERQTVPAWAGISLEWAAAMGVKTRRERSERSERKDAVVRKLRTLLETAEAGEPVTAQDLRWVLGRFAEYSRRELEKK
jgi:hypothetical protein